jgi:hypothetical protein
MIPVQSALPHPEPSNHAFAIFALVEKRDQPRGGPFASANLYGLSVFSYLGCVQIKNAKSGLKPVRKVERQALAKEPDAGSTGTATAKRL